MKNGTLSGLVICLVIAILISGCDKSEDKKVEAPPAKEEMMQQDARSVQETAEQTVQSATERASIAAEEQRLAAEKAMAEEEQRLAAEKEKAMAEEAAAREKAAKLERDIGALGAVMTERGLAMTLEGVAFDVNKADLRPESIPAIEKVASFLREYSDRQALVEGFTDSSGGAARNQELSERRALAVRQAIIDRGVGTTRIDSKGYGEEFPVDTNETPVGRKMNRRVEIIISDGADVIAARTN